MKKTLYVFWVGVSKKGNTSLLLSTEENPQFERRDVKFGGKTLQQIILPAMEDNLAGGQPNPDKPRTYSILLEGNHEATFPSGTAVPCTITEDIVANGPKGALYLAVVSGK